MKKNMYLEVGVVVVLTCVLVSCAAPAQVAAPALPAPATEMVAPNAISAPAPGESPIIDNMRKYGKVRAGVAIAAPWLFQNPTTKKFIGAPYDVSVKLSEILGLPLEIVDSNWDVIIAGLQSDKFDLAIAPLFASPKRMEVVDFVNYTVAGTCYGALKDNIKVNSLDDFNKSSVSIVTYTGTGTEEGILKSYPEISLRSLVQGANVTANMDEVVAGRADLAPFDSTNQPVLLKQYPNIKIIPDNCIANPDIAYPIGMAFAKNDPKFTAFLRAVVDSMQKEIDASIGKYSDPANQ